MSKLTFEALRKANAARAPRWHTSEAGMMEWTIGDWFMAMAGEVGEGADEFLPLMFTAFVGKVGQLGNMAKKYRRVQEGIANKSDDPERQIDASNAISKMFDEIADVQIYLDLFALRLREALNTGEDIGDHVERVFNKTSEKYSFPERIVDGRFMLAERGKFLINGVEYDGEVYRIPDEPEPITMRLDDIADIGAAVYGDILSGYSFNKLHVMGDRIVGNTPNELVIGRAGAKIEAGWLLTIGKDGRYYPINTEVEKPFVERRGIFTEDLAQRDAEAVRQLAERTVTRKPDC